MYTVELALRNNPLPLSVQRHELDAAEELYKTVLAAMQKNSQTPIIELTCEKFPNKKLAVMVEDISAVQVSEKASASLSTGVGFTRN
ncbi:hypothetical protein Pse7367_2166 [Thalassoporum mexicanum PCC 7367]|uniref:hypothetical protein n=1 Tax=Thalassoporum mexicanum TaxID=3457544 RepID=UPI00029FFBF3|nr:hypothetical protein [Pseudanabaena sp. PCC 7367]AFY70430.1 hypothetical protein Pse7367_2166 [Pseudanabaena sp. PCC 7367]